MATIIGNLSLGNDTILGTAADDIIQVPSNIANLTATDIISGGAGRDVLCFLRNIDLSVSYTRLTGISGIDVFDVTLATSVVLSFDDAAIVQSDADAVSILFDADPLSLDLRAVTSAVNNGIVIAGSGTVTLYDAARQSLRIADGVNGTVIGGSGRDRLTGGTGADSLTGGAGDDILTGGAGQDSLTGGLEQDWLFGGGDADVLRGDAGFDLLSGGTGSTTTTGGTEADTFVVTVGETLTITDFAIANRYERVDLRAFAGLGFADLVIATVGGNARITLPGATTITLLGVAPAALREEMFVFAGDTVVTMAAGLGVAPFFEFTDATDDATGNGGDNVFELKGNLAKLDAADRFDGGAGTDVLRVWGADRSLSPERLTGMASVEVIDLTGASVALAVTVNAAMVAQSGSGTMTIKQGVSAIFLDTELAGDAGNVIVEGTGAVTLRDAFGQSVTVSDAIGGTVIGGNKHDEIRGGARGDLLTGLAGDDSLSGGGGHDSLLGGDGNDTLAGDAGNDSLDGGLGNDRLISDSGNDLMTGGGGNDSFVVRQGSGITTLADYDRLNFLERIDLTDFAALAGVGNLTFTNQGADVRVTAGGLNVLVQGAQAGQLDADDFLFAGQDPLVFNVSADTPMAQLQQLIKDAPAGAVIHLAAGTYSVTQTLLIDRSDISLIGAGEGQTIFRTDIAAGDAAQTILVQPGQQQIRLGTIALDAAQGSSMVTLNAGHGLQVGDLLYVSQANDAAWLAATGNTGWQEPASTLNTAEDYYLRETRAKIVAIDGNTVTLAEPLPYAFTAGIATAAQSTFLSGVVLSGFSIEGSWGAPDPFLFEDTLADWVSIAALELDGVRDSDINHITITNPAAHAFKLQRIYDVTGETLTSVGAHNKSGSSGYQFYFNEAFSNDFTGLTALDGRHAVLFSSYSAEHYNNIAMLLTNRDINFHGSPDADNTLFIAQMLQDYPQGSDPEWAAVGPGVFPLHPNATIDANDVTFGHAVTGGRRDVVRAADGGAFISTGFGNDMIIGGAGADTLDGGENGDRLLGGGGADMFIRQYADFTDTILDFQAGAGGDVLVIKGSGYGQFADLNLRQSGSDVVLDFGPGGMTIFANLTLADLIETNFLLQADTLPGQMITLKATELFAVGTDKGDTIIASRAHLDAPDFLVRGGGGFDTVKFNVSSLFGALEETGSYFGIDAIDVSGVATVSVSVGNLMPLRSDNGNFHLRIGDVGSMLLNVGPLGAGKTIWVDGARAVQLYGGIGHTVKFTDRIGANVTGDSLRDVIYGSRNGDWIDAAGGTDVVFAAAGDDTVSGGSGADLLNGGPGSDTYLIDDLGDRVAESNRWLGTDLVISSVNFQLGTAHVENLTLTGTAILGVGNGLINVITGNDSNNILDGGKNNDTLIGGLGNDTYLLRAPGSMAVELAGGGIDTVKAFRSTLLDDNVENLYIQTLRNAAGQGVAGVNGVGNALDNIIVGNPFDNAISGREGNDTLRGQGGADAFVFDRAPGPGNVDSILDFAPGEDTIRLKGALFGLPAVGFAAGALGFGTVASTAGQRILYDRSTGNLWSDHDGNGAAAPVLFATLSNLAPLTAGDFGLF